MADNGSRLSEELGNTVNLMKNIDNYIEDNQTLMKDHVSTISQTSSIIEEIKRTKRPVVLTQHGRSAAVVLDVAEYEKIMEKMELISDIELAESQISKGQGISHEQVKSQVLKRLHK